MQTGKGGNGGIAMGEVAGAVGAAVPPASDNGSDMGTGPPAPALVSE